MLTICLVILSLHFLRVFAGNCYRASVAIVLPAVDLARTLGRTKVVSSMRIREDGSVVETEEVVGDPDQLSRFERVKFFLHLLLSN